MTDLSWPKTVAMKIPEDSCLAGSEMVAAGGEEEQHSHCRRPNFRDSCY